MYFFLAVARFSDEELLAIDAISRLVDELVLTLLLVQGTEL